MRLLIASSAAIYDFLQSRAYCTANTDPDSDATGEESS
jgi:hypothetical protein